MIIHFKHSTVKSRIGFFVSALLVVLIFFRASSCNEDTPMQQSVIDEVKKDLEKYSDYRTENLTCTFGGSQIAVSLAPGSTINVESIGKCKLEVFEYIYKWNKYWLAYDPKPTGKDTALTQNGFVSRVSNDKWMQYIFFCSNPEPEAACSLRLKIVPKK